MRFLPFLSSNPKSSYTIRSSQRTVVHQRSKVVCSAHDCETGLYRECQFQPEELHRTEKGTEQTIRWFLVSGWWNSQVSRKEPLRAECRTNEVNQHSASRIRQQCWKAPALSVLHVPIAIAIGCNFIYLSAKCCGAEAQIGDTVK